jgi:hypothetical protein
LRELTVFLITDKMPLAVAVLFGFPLWLVETIWFFGEVIACFFVSPGPAAAADTNKLAFSAFPLVEGRVPQVLKDLRLKPDFLKPSFLDLSAVQLEIAAGLDLTRMGDEAEGYSSQAAAGHGMQGMPRPSALSPGVS